MSRWWHIFGSLGLVVCSELHAIEILQNSLEKIVSQSEGRIGACVLELSQDRPICVHGEQKFQLQSVMKMITATAVMELVDQKKIKLSDKLILTPGDASPGPQDFALMIKSKGRHEATVEELMRRSVIESDSTSVDVLLKYIGGPFIVQSFLQNHKIDGLRIDRNERDVQTESVGLKWQDVYADNAKLDAAIKALPEKNRETAWRAHLVDGRDTSTPVAMVHFLSALASGKLLSKPSTEKILAIMGEVQTGRDRLQAATPKGWVLMHKTGTSRNWRGMNGATNDVGIFKSPSGTQVAVAVFVTESKASDAERADVIARIARRAIQGRK